MQIPINIMTRGLKAIPSVSAIINACRSVGVLQILYMTLSCLPEDMVRQKSVIAIYQQQITRFLHPLSMSEALQRFCLTRKWGRKGSFSISGGTSEWSNAEQAQQPRPCSACQPKISILNANGSLLTQGRFGTLHFDPHGHDIPQPLSRIPFLPVDCNIAGSLKHNGSGDSCFSNICTIGYNKRLSYW